MVEGEGAAVVFVWGERLAYLLVVYKQAGQIFNTWCIAVPCELISEL